MDSNSQAQAPSSSSVSPEAEVGQRAAADEAAGARRQHRAETAASTFLRDFHLAMRGRYTVAVLLGLLVGAAAAAACWRFGRPEYHSSGLLRIAYTLPEVLQQTDQNRPMLMFDTFMTSQKLLITSRRVIDMAIQDPIWKATGRAVPLNPDQYFAQHLTVEIKPRSEFISISVADQDPGTAAAAVTAITNAYSELYNSQEKQLERQRTGVLEDRQTFLQGRIDQTALQIRTSAQEYGTTNLEVFYEAAATRVTRLEGALNDVRVALASAQDVPEQQDGTEAPAAGDNQAMSVEEIARIDPVMKTYMDEQLRLENEQSRFIAMGYGENHRAVVLNRTALDAATARVARYANAYRQFRSVTAQNLGDARNKPIETAGKSAAVLRANEESLVKLHKEAKQEMIALGAKKMDLQRQEEERKTLRDELEGLTHRTEVLRAEGSLGGRLSIISSGEIPLSPDKDPRLKLAAAGGAVGTLLPAGLIFLTAFIRRRYRYSDDAQAQLAGREIPMLGILPELSPGGGDREDQFSAAHCVHQIRVSLEARSAGMRSRIFLVTSATASEGKTSMAVSLGLSFAAAKLRTLVIDGDMVGRHLTSNFGAQDIEGLHEALVSGHLNGQVRRTNTGLYVLTAGRGSARDGCAIPVAASRSIFAQARANYDVILIDSGPILGSVEAAVFAREADGVIFTITRGQQREIVQMAIRRLQSLGATIAGVLFNRAKRHDLQTSAYSSSYSSPARTDSNQNALQLQVSRPASERLKRFGPLVQAVAAHLPSLNCNVN